MSQKSLPIIVLDFETGGLNAQENAFTEIAAISFDSTTFEEIARYEAVVKPYSGDLLYDPKALQVTGISMEMINNGLDFKVFVKDFFNFLKKSNIHSHQKYRPILSGHNITFDIQFLQQLFHYSGKRIEDYFNCTKDYKGNYQPKYIDTLPLTMIKWPEILNHTLGDAVNKAGFELVSAHRAMNDVKANVDLLISFLKSLRNENVNTNDNIEKDSFKNFRETFKF